MAKPNEKTFEQQLATWGPQANHRRVLSLQESRAYCREFMRSHYENFTVVSWMLPRKLRQHFANVYAWCRWADDLGDEVDDRDRSRELLAWWRDELSACYANAGRHPVSLALAETIRQYQIPRELFLDLISAFEQDQEVREYQTWSQLADYCRRSANPVGRLVLYLCEQTTDQNFADSDAVCTGLQLANFWQDVARDHEMGRLYLPREDRIRFGYDQQALDQRITNQPFQNLMKFEVERARLLLIRGLSLSKRMPGRLQIDIELFARGGLRILEKIEQIDYRVWDIRPVVSRWDQLRLLSSCSLRAVGRLFRRTPQVL